MALGISDIIITCKDQDDFTGSDQLKVSVKSSKGSWELCTVPISTGQTKSINSFVGSNSSRRLVSDGDIIEVKEIDTFDADDLILNFRVKTGVHTVSARTSAFNYSFKIDIV